MEKLEKTRSPEADSVVPDGDDLALHDAHEMLDNRIFSREKIVRLHSDFDKTEAAGVLRDYEQGFLPTIPHLRESIEALVIKAAPIVHSDSLGEEDRQVLTLLKGRPRQIEFAIRSYAQAVIRHVRLKKLREGGISDPETFVKADHARRRAHNALFESLSTLNKALELADELGLISMERDVYVYKHGSQMPTPANQIPTFDPRLLDKSNELNREFILHWAIAADFDKCLKQLDAIANENTQKE